jgi:hypothetical protein
MKALSSQPPPVAVTESPFPLSFLSFGATPIRLYEALLRPTKAFERKNVVFLRQTNVFARQNVNFLRQTKAFARTNMTFLCQTEAFLYPTKAFARLTKACKRLLEFSGHSFQHARFSPNFFSSYK